ncbi:MAG TPA: hypothetical protein VNO33_02680 [Kofleriaceae bacterium]|nr:hypothetical protein [Kofleriaceae bacterium]
MAAGVAGCSTSVDGGATPVGGEPGGGQGLGIDVDGGDPAGGGGCEGESCDVYQQCGCSAGQACDLDGADLASGATECREVASPGQTQSNCDAADQCAAGYSCLGDPGQCRKMCDEDGDCGAGYCVVQVVFENDEGAFEDVPNARACTKQCTPEAGFDSGCPSEPDLGCRVFTDDPDGEAGSGDERDYTDCTPSGTGRDTADCSQNGDADCAPGFGCYVITYTDDTQADECREICVVDVGGVPQSNRCGEGTCNGFATRSLIGDVEYGLCF